jgi:hypothetical protein
MRAGSSSKAAEVETGDSLFAFVPLPPSQSKSARTTNAIERLHEELKRRVKTQTVLPSAETAAKLFWALLASGQISMRKVDGWQTLGSKLSISQLTSQLDQAGRQATPASLAACASPSARAGPKYPGRWIPAQSFCVTYPG